MSEETKKEKYEGHGNNWKAFIEDFDGKFGEMLVRAANNKDCKYLKNKERLDVGDFLGIVNDGPPLSTLVLCHIEEENSQVYSYYPFIQMDNPLDVEISKIDEWENGGEAVIWGSVNGVSVSFFDTLYFLNKDKYKIGETYQFNIVGLAHSFSKRIENLEFVAEEGPMKGEKFYTANMTSFVPNHGYGGEFSYMSPFESFSGTIEALGSKFYQYPFYLKNLEDGIAFSFPLFIRDKILGEYKPELNDPIAGTGWLQGYLVDSLKD